MRLQLEKASARVILACTLLGLVLALLVYLGAAILPTKALLAAAFLLLAGPIGALTTHMHVPLFALLVMAVLAVVLGASVSRNYRRSFVIALIVLWFVMGALFASIWLSSYTQVVVQVSE